jgi:hypothetical protein
MGAFLRAFGALRAGRLRSLPRDLRTGARDHSTHPKRALCLLAAK